MNRTLEDSKKFLNSISKVINQIQIRDVVFLLTGMFIMWITMMIVFSVTEKFDTISVPTQVPKNLTAGEAIVLDKTAADNLKSSISVNSIVNMEKVNSLMETMKSMIANIIAFFKNLLSKIGIII